MRKSTVFWKTRPRSWYTWPTSSNVSHVILETRERSVPVPSCFRRVLQLAQTRLEACGRPSCAQATNGLDLQIGYSSRFPRPKLVNDDSVTAHLSKLMLSVLSIMDSAGILGASNQNVDSTFLYRVSLYDSSPALHVYATAFGRLLWTNMLLKI